MKKLAIVLAAALVLSALTACGSTETSTTAADTTAAAETTAAEETTAAADEAAPNEVGGDDVVGTGTMTGAYTFSEAKVIELPEDVKTAFDTAMTDYVGVGFEPVAYVGVQVVSGINYAILCKATATTPDAVPTMDVVVIYAALDGTAEITSVVDITTVEVPENNENSETEVDATGAWTIPEDMVYSVEVDTTEAEIFNSVCEPLVNEVVYAPVSLLGTQVVAGTNYLYLAKADRKLDNDETSTYLALLTIYEDLSGNTELTSAVPFNVEDYIEQ